MSVVWSVRVGVPHDGRGRVGRHGTEGPNLTPTPVLPPSTRSRYSENPLVSKARVYSPFSQGPVREGRPSPGFSSELYTPIDGPYEVYRVPKRGEGREVPGRANVDHGTESDDGLLTVAEG